MKRFGKCGFARKAGRFFVLAAMAAVAAGGVRSDDCAVLQVDNDKVLIYETPGQYVFRPTVARARVLVVGGGGAGGTTIGGGGAFVSGSKGVLRRSVVDNNVIENGYYGGGIYTPGGGVVESCLIVSNRASYGGGIYLDGALYATNCTVVGNSSSMGAGIYGWSSWKNSRFANTIVRPQLGVAFGGGDSTNGLTAVFSHCAIEKAYKPNGGTQYVFPEENGNTRTLPEFVDAAGGDYRQTMRSPLRRAGLYAPWMHFAADLDGRRRAPGGMVDMGCYQRPSGGGRVLVR